MSRFKERLWRELVREHGADLATISRPAAHGRVAQPRLLAGTTVGLAGVGTVVALVLSAASSSPAFAVTQNNDGTVSVVITRLAAIHGVNERLAKLGFRARFVHVAADCADLPPAAIAERFARTQVRIGAVTIKAGNVNARFDPRKIPAGQILVMGAWREGRTIRADAASITAGGVPACLPVPPPSVHGGVFMQVAPGTVRCVVTGPAIRKGNSGSSGNSGNSGESTITRAQPLGSEVKPACPAWAHVPAQVRAAALAAAAHAAAAHAATAHAATTHASRAKTSKR